MKYFVSCAERMASGSSCYYEFAIGRWQADKNAHWADTSLNISDALMGMLGLHELIGGAVKCYAPYGITYINADEWEKIKHDAERLGGEAYAAILELAPLAEDSLKKYNCFTILGI